MKVADLQQHLADLGKLLNAAAGGKTLSREFAVLANALQPFREFTFKAFSDFLARADADSRRPKTEPVAGASPKQKRGKTSSTDIGALVTDVKNLYERADKPSVTQADIDAIIGRLEPLNKAQLVVVSEAIGMTKMNNKNKGAIIAAIGHRILEVKGSSQRTGMIDRSPFESETNEVVETGAPR